MVNGDEEAYGLCSADSSNFYAAGLTAPFYRNVYILKLDQFGDTLWTRILESGLAVKVVSVSDGGCIYIGYNGNRALMGRLNTNGTVIWQRTMSSISVYDIVRAHDKGFIICGENTNTGNLGGYLCKIDSLGNTLWSKTYNVGDMFAFTVIKQKFQSGYVLGGSMIDTGGSSRKAFIMETNDTGSPNWQRAYSLVPFVSDLVLSETGYILSGISSYKVMIMRTNLSGDSVKCRIFQNTNNVYSINLLSAAPNKFYVAHSNDPYGRIFSVDSNLNIIKELMLQPTQYSCGLYSVINAPNSLNSDILCAGLTAVVSAGNSDMYVARLDSSLTAPPPITIRNLSSEVPNKFSVSQNYPNPFNPKTIIKFDLPKEGLVTITVYDILGRFVSSVKEFRKAGVYEYDFDGSALASGLYFYKVESGVFSETKKMVLVK